VGRECSTNRKKRTAYRSVLLGRPGHRWVNNVKMDLGYIGRGGVDWLRIGICGLL
jgi:hypothetical protein